MTPDGPKLLTNLEGRSVETPEGTVVLASDGPQLLVPARPKPARHKRTAATGANRRRRGGQYEELPIARVEKAEKRLRERAKVTRKGERATGHLTYEAIATYSSLNRDRIDRDADRD